jgi:hypothetical protein
MTLQLGGPAANPALPKLSHFEMLTSNDHIGVMGQKVARVRTGLRYH